MDSVLCQSHVNYWATISTFAFVFVVAVGYIYGVYYLKLKIPYGRFFVATWWAGPGLNPKFSWMFQESPAFFFPFCTLLYNVHIFVNKPINAFFLFLFSCHYFNRTFVYPLRIRGGKPSSLLTVIFAFFFCLTNGFLQSHHFLCIAEYSPSYYVNFRFILGVVVFVVGAAVNIHSDGILRDLRKPGETGYKIPRGGMFEYVSSANFFGEIVEWWGFWIASSGGPPLAFALLATLVLTGKASMHQRWRWRRSGGGSYN